MNRIGYNGTYLQKILQALNILNRIAQDFDLGQTLVGIGRCASLQNLKGLVNLECMERYIN